MCHATTWKVNFRPLGLRSRAEEDRRRLTQPGMETQFPLPPLRSFSERSARSPHPGAEGGVEARAAASAQPLCFLPLGNGLEISRPSSRAQKKPQTKPNQTTHIIFALFAGVRLTGRRAVLSTDDTESYLESHRLLVQGPRLQALKVAFPKGVRKMLLVGANICNAL